jgi:hypothetical protein
MTGPFYTFKIPDSAIVELMCASGRGYLPSAIETLRIYQHELELGIANILSDYDDWLKLIKGTVEIRPNALEWIISAYDNRYGSDAVPIYAKSTLEFCEAEFNADFRDQFHFLLKVQVRPAVVIHNGVVYKVENSTSAFSFRKCTVTPWLQNETQIAVEEVETYSLRKLTFGTCFYPTLNDEPWHEAFRHQCYEAKQRVLNGDGQEHRFDNDNQA